jgi:predicted permease
MIRWRYTLRLRLRSLLLRDRVERELTDELRFHLAKLIEEQIARGVSPDKARSAARRELGGIDQIKEACRDARRVTLFEHLLHDIQYGLRQLRRNPAFSAAAIATLALGIGANAAIFSVIEGVMFAPLPFASADRIVRIYATRDGLDLAGRRGPSPMDVRDLAEGNHSFQAMAVYDTWRKNVSFGEGQIQPEQRWVGLVPAAYFEVLDVKPILGRAFTAGESYVGKHYAAAISADVWRTRFNADPAILGRTIRINAEPYVIVAVMPDVIPEWMEGKTVQIWTPFGFADTVGDLWTEAGRGARGYYSLGRLKPGVALEEAQGDLTAMAARLGATHAADRGFGVALERLSQTRADAIRSMLLLLMGAVAFILLIACVNVANLLLARNSVRERELATRAALGASARRLIGQMLVETILLALLGGGVGLALARGGVALLARAHPAELPQLGSIAFDWRVVVFTAAVSVATALVFGLGPALTANRGDLGKGLKSRSRSGTPGVHARYTRNAMVAAEVGLSLMLLAASGLLIRSILLLERQQLGVSAPDHLLSGHFYLPPVRYPDPEAITRFSDQFADRIRSLPGVVDASITTIIPPTYDWSQMFALPGRPAARIQEVPSAQCGFTDRHFLKTMGIPLLRGRDFAESDTSASAPVVLVNETFVHRYLSKQDPIGLRFHIGPPPSLNIPAGDLTTDSSDVTIVGVFKDFRNSGLAAPSGPQILALYAQHPLVTYGFRDIVIRTAPNPHAMIASAARQLHLMDPELPFAQARTIDEIVQQQMTSQRFATLLLTVFAGLGLALAAVGVYGVVSYSVAQRTRELGLRMALGAQKRSVLGIVIGNGLRVALVGVAAGVLGALGVTRLLAGLLYGVTPADPMTFAAVSFILALVVLLASYLPARRAANIDPMIALRHE